MFDAWGPFDLESPAWDDVDDLYQQARETLPDLMDKGRGVYVVYTEGEGGMYQPWYVGQTQQHFGERLYTHFKTQKFAKLFECGSVRIILLARARDGAVEEAKTDTQKARDKKYIDWLEIELIRAASKANPRLLNKQHVAFFESLHVPGYHEQGEPDRSLVAAKVIRQLFKS